MYLVTPHVRVCCGGTGLAQTAVGRQWHFAHIHHLLIHACYWLQVPIYDFKQSKRVGYNTVPVPESRVVIIEGIYALSERLKSLLDLRVSITGGID